MNKSINHSVVYRNYTVVYKNHSVVFINTSCIYKINDEKTDFSYRQNSVYNKRKVFPKKREA